MASRAGRASRARLVSERRSGRQERAKFVVRAADADKESADDVVARLAKAEDEAAELRKMLAAFQAPSAEIPEQKIVANKRVDGTGFRETIWSVQKGQGENAKTVKTGEDWLQEGDVNFFTGDGPSETAESNKMSDADQGEVTRRLLIGLAGVAAFIAVGLIPEKESRPKPTKPQFFYLVPLLRIQKVLPDLAETVKTGNVTAVKAGVKTVIGSPNNAKDNMINAALYLENDKEYQRANAMTLDFVEYMAAVDFTEYFDSRVAVTERQVDFSVQAAKAAEAKLAEFLKLMPADQLEAAQTQIF